MTISRLLFMKWGEESKEYAKMYGHQNLGGRQQRYREKILRNKPFQYNVYFLITLVGVNLVDSSGGFVRCWWVVWFPNNDTAENSKCFYNKCLLIRKKSEKQDTLGWEDSLVTKVLAVPEWGQESDCQYIKIHKARHASGCLWSQHRGSRGRRILWSCWPVSLDK